MTDTEDLDPNQLRKQGNDAFGGQRYETAARCYSRALECSNIMGEDKLACWSNLAEVRLRQEMWEAAEAASKAALELDDAHSKSNFRLATAQINLNKFDEASATVADEKGKVFGRLRADIKDLLQEKNGNFNLKKMHKEASRRPGQPLATLHANYRSTQIQQGVEIAKREGFAYRGTVATEDIASNSLVSSSKALVFCQEQRNSFDYTFDPYSRSVLKGSNMELESKLVLLMYRRPTLKKSINSLASGLEDLASPQDCEKIDVKRIQGIVASNTFGFSEMDDVGQA